MYDIGGRGDLSFNDSAAAGLDQAAQEFGVQVQELEPNQGGTNRAELLDLLASQGTNLIIGVGFLFAETVCAAGNKYPDVNFGDVDGFINKDTANCKGAHDLTAEDNVASLLFAEEQGSFLVGAAAALKSTTGHVGFIGGVDIDLIHKFEAGFVAGAKQINPDITVDIKYITQPPDFAGFNDPAKAKEIAASMFEGGADVVYHAAGGSGLGLFEAAKEYSDSSGTHVWAIGVDSDQYQTAPADLQPYILTSMLKRVDVAVYETIKSQVEGTFAGGYHHLRPLDGRRRLLDVGRVRRRHRVAARGPEGADHRRHDHRSDVVVGSDAAHGGPGYDAPGPRSMTAKDSVG